MQKLQQTEQHISDILRIFMQLQATLREQVKVDIQSASEQPKDDIIQELDLDFGQSKEDVQMSEKPEDELSS